MPTAIPSLDPETFGAFGAFEIARELATLVMIVAVGWLAGRTRRIVGPNHQGLAAVSLIIVIDVGVGAIPPRRHAVVRCPGFQ